MLTVLNRQRKVPFDLEENRPRLEAVMIAAGAGRKEVTLLLASDAAIRRLNREWRHISKPTDCLSFPSREGEGARYAGPFLGDVVISLETAARQAAERGATLDDEVLLLFVHSLLHLQGYDHQDARGERRMNAKTRALVQAVTGIAG
ncbi:MAG: rRNA maturation RNase YbeY [Deltaproteobacteria bacterium]|nr:rRNA maturation RNase YbeY [Deltaproteobacteria bacterium]